MFLRSIIVPACLWALALPVAFADNAVAAARWDFGTEETTPMVARGGVQRDQAGPLPPEFPDFSPDNTAVRFDGRGAYLSVPDTGVDSPFDFTNGDAITLEAWVLVDEIRDGQAMYVIGKGRTNSPHVQKDNQNWAMRVVGAGGQARLGFLFATPQSPDGASWHRWTSAAGFHIVTGWHHIAVAYEFGRPESIRGWIDGVPTAGVWDMGGPTTKAPVVDDDEVWIGSSLGGNQGSSFNGLLDAIAVHRTLLDDATVASRFSRTGGPRVIGPLPEVMPAVDNVPSGQVTITISEGMPTHERWLNEGEEWPTETARWATGAFLLPRIPLRYDEWGIRKSWKAPVLVRMAADVELTGGAHRFLVRARALGRLWVDGQLVARTDPLVQSPPNGEEPMTPLVEPLRPGMRLPGYRMREVLGEFTVDAKGESEVVTVRVVLEIVAGGKGFRTETGEVVVALETADGQFYNLLQPASSGEAPVPLSDDAVTPVLAKIETSLDALDDQTRRRAADSRAAYWARRHEAARAWVAENPAPAVPSGEGLAKHPVDAFIDAKIALARAASANANVEEATHFHQNILPILREACFRCHDEKEKGGLRLNSRDALLKAGDSEIPAVVPGDPGASELLHRIRSEDDDLRMPPTGKGLPAAQIEALETWIQSGAPWPAAPDAAADTAQAPLLADAPFIRRLYLDTVGVPPSEEELIAFVLDRDPDKRAHWIDILLEDERAADHAMSDWQDMLAENPTIINPSLNSTGPFRWYLYEALRDNKPLDRMVSELVLMRGAAHEGGSAGFALAAENDAPFAEKGHIVASAFLGIEMQCARCHDAPYHQSTQRDLFSLAAMLGRKAVAVPESSTVPAGFFANLDRPPLIRVTLNPGESVEPEWPFDSLTGAANAEAIAALIENPEDTRARLAAYMTAPHNERFAQVMVNRIWKRLMGAGIVEPVHDWEGHEPSHPELLRWLARELAANAYDMRHVTRLILTSAAYQREAEGRNLTASPQQRYFNVPDRRRLTAEQVVDTLHRITDAPMDTEELTFVHDGRREVSNRLTLETPTRAWMFASLANERDRPSLALPRAQTITDVLEAFGWSGSRQKPVTQRETEPNVLQPGVLANGTLAMNLTRAAEGSALAQRAVEAPTPEVLVNMLFTRLLGRMPNGEEHRAFSTILADGFEDRLVPAEERVRSEPLPPLQLVTWFNHLQGEANTIQQEIERRVRRGPPPDGRLRAEWRERYEDVVWGIINHVEFVWVP